MTIKTPMAFILVKFQGSNDEPMTKSDAEKMFTSTGCGTMNVVDWFHDNTHGSIDMSGNEVFGWLTLSQKQSDYKGSGANPAGRLEIIDWAKQAATAARIDLSKFTAVVVVTNVEVDLFGGVGHVCCTAAKAGKQFWEIQAAPSVLCQEMIHGLGIYNHARRQESTADYRDPYDVMSMFAAWPGHMPTDSSIPIGPGLNAAFMKRCGWLDTTRAASLGRADLRPLHRRDLSGPLYAMVDKYYVEYRPSHRWDSGFPSVVLVHYIADNTSYLVAELGAGSEFSWGNPLDIFFSSHGSIKVEAIDDAALTASIEILYSPRRRLPVLERLRWVQEPFYQRYLEDIKPSIPQLSEIEITDVGGIVIIDDRIIKIPSRSLEFHLVEAAAALASLNDVQMAQTIKSAARVDIYAQTAAEINEAREHITGVSSPLDIIEEARHFHRRDKAK